MLNMFWFNSYYYHHFISAIILKLWGLIAYKVPNIFQKVLYFGLLSNLKGVIYLKYPLQALNIITHINIIFPKSRKTSYFTKFFWWRKNSIQALNFFISKIPFIVIAAVLLKPKGLIGGKSLYLSRNIKVNIWRKYNSDLTYNLAQSIFRIKKLTATDNNESSKIKWGVRKSKLKCTSTKQIYELAIHCSHRRVSHSHSFIAYHRDDHFHIPNLGNDNNINLAFWIINLFFILGVPKVER